MYSIKVKGMHYNETITRAEIDASLGRWTRINGYAVFLKENGAFVRNSKISIKVKLILS
jgi:hypothetical protein